LKHNDEVELLLSDAAHELGLSWAATWRLVLTGALDGQRDRISGRWRVKKSSVERVKRARAERPSPVA
jgi:hypothetical protein